MVNVARVPSPAKVVLGLELRVHPQPAIIFRLLNQPCLYRILSDVFAFLLQTLIRPQHMIEGFLFPDRTGSVKQLIDTMSSRALQTLQNVHERIRPALFIAEWQEKHMDVVGHDYGCIEMNPCGAGALARERLDATFPQTMFENQVAGVLRQCQMSTSTECDEHRRVGLLQVRKPPAIAVFSQRGSLVDMERVGRAPPPAISDSRVSWCRVSSQ